MRFASSLSICLALVTGVLSQELTTFWYESIAKQGKAPYNSQGSAYQVYRNVKDFGAKGRINPRYYDEDNAKILQVMESQTILPQSISLYPAAVDARQAFQVLDANPAPHRQP
jgi:hypothetical protein